MSDATETEAYIDKCVGALDDVMDWDEDVMGYTPPELVAMAEYITPRCDECGIRVLDMDEQQRAHHRIYRGMVLVCCEGYWQINPVALGIPAEVSGNWSDWTRVNEGDMDLTIDDIDDGTDDQ